MAWKAYFDETSDGKQERVYAIGGYLGPEEAWTQQFEPLWNGALESQKLGRGFHMTEFEARSGEFTGWDEFRRIAFIRELICIVNDSAIWGFQSAIALRDFNAVFPGLDRFAPYFLCFRTCIENALLITKELEEDIAFVFDEKRERDKSGRVIQDKAQEFFDTLRTKLPDGARLGSRTFALDEKFLPLQAADLVAWEGRRLLDNEIQGLTIPIRKSLDLLRRKDRLFGKVWNRQTLEDEKRLGLQASDFSF